MQQEAGSIVTLKSTIVCPNCGHQTTETMPTDACQFFYDCVGCGAVLRPEPGDCCVFCSYGSVICPPRQITGASGATDRCCGSLKSPGRLATDKMSD